MEEAWHIEEGGIGGLGEGAVIGGVGLEQNKKCQKFNLELRIPGGSWLANIKKNCIFL